MRPFVRLLHKEWRDHRVLVLLALALTLLVVAGARVLFGHTFDAELRTRWVLPAFGALFLAAIAADSAARESNDGVGDTLGRLPVTTSTLWGAKITFLLAAAVAFQLWLVGMELTLRALLGEADPTEGATFLRPGLWALTTASTAAVFAFASLLRRSFPGALLGLGLVIGAPFAWPLLPPGPLRDWLAVGIDPWTPVTLAWVAALAFLLGSVGAYSPWGSRVDDLRRRILPGALGFTVVFGPAFGASAVIAERRVDLVPHGPGVHLGTVEASPDGRFVALEVSRDWRSSWGFEFIERRYEVWILDRSTGRLHTVDDRARGMYRPGFTGWQSSAWGEDGRLGTFSFAGPFMGGDWEEVQLEAIDPATGRVASRISDPTPRDVQIREAEMGHVRWYERKWTGEGRRWVGWRGREEWFVLPKSARLAISSEPGVIFHEDEAGDLVRHDLATGEARLLVDTEGSIRWSLEVSFDGRFLSFIDDGGLSVVDSSSGARLYGPSPGAFFQSWSRVPGRVAYLFDVPREEGLVVVTREGSQRVRAPRGVRLLDLDASGEYFLAASPETLSVIDPEGRIVERLYGPGTQ